MLAQTVLDGPAGQAERRLGRTLRFTLPATVVGEPVPVHIRSGSFVPDEVGQAATTAASGSPIVGVQVGAGPGGLLARALPVLISQPLSDDWARSYGTIVANSAFTQGWVRRRWGLDSTVLHPPVRMREPGTKERSILNVGRFFGEGLGHSKRQLDLVTAFRQLVDGRLAGWTLHLAGGCSHEGRSYLDAVRQRAEGYPVELHVDASGSEIDRLYQAAAIYWHASGLGVDPERRPDVLEHFGISTVEAMSAGAVPVVVGLGGLVETVRHGVDGYHFQTIDGLASITVRLAGDPGAVARLSASARRRAQAFSVGAFGERFDRIVTELLKSHPPPMTLP